jgi:chemotaxis protein MotB
MSAPSKQDIIIKRVKKIHHGSHGGAWKIAYADFVTAMMAFFLLMWLINAASEDTKKGIADYFTTAIVTFKESSGAEGTMSGQNQQSINNSNIAQENVDDMEYNVLNSKVRKEQIKSVIEEQLFPDDNAASEIGEHQGIKGSNSVRSYSDQANLNSSFTSEQSKSQESTKNLHSKEALKKSLKDDLKAQEKLSQQVKKFEEIMKTIKEALNSIKELEIFKRNLILELTDQGLKIQIMDDDKHEMFKLGDPSPMQHTRLILNALGRIISKLPNKISVTGHTDSKPYANKQAYGNWELSSDRAHSTRRVLEESGVNADQFMDIVGRGDREPFNKLDHFAPENRRISIMISYDLLEEGQQQNSENNTIDTKSKEAEAINKPEQKVN